MPPSKTEAQLRRHREQPLRAAQRKEADDTSDLNYPAPSDCDGTVFATYINEGGDCVARRATEGGGLLVARIVFFSAFDPLHNFTNKHMQTRVTRIALSLKVSSGLDDEMKELRNLYETACKEAETTKTNFDAREAYIRAWWLSAGKENVQHEGELLVWVEKLRVMHADMHALQKRLQNSMANGWENMEVKKRQRLEKAIKMWSTLLGHFATLAKTPDKPNPPSTSSRSGYLPDASPRVTHRSIAAEFVDSDADDSDGSSVKRKVPTKFRDYATVDVKTGKITKVSNGILNEEYWSNFNITSNKPDDGIIDAADNLNENIQPRSLDEIIARVASKQLTAPGKMAPPMLPLSALFKATMEKLESLNLEEKINILGLNATTFRDPEKKYRRPARVTGAGTIRKPEPKAPKIESGIRKSKMALPQVKGAAFKYKLGAFVDMEMTDVDDTDAEWDKLDWGF